MGATLEQWRWLAGNDSGASSATIWAALMGEGPGRLESHVPFTPMDADDFGRCVRLLDRFPEWRARLGEVAERYREWGPLVERWDELERMYRSSATRELSAACWEIMLRGAPEGGR